MKGYYQLKPGQVIREADHYSHNGIPANEEWFEGQIADGLIGTAVKPEPFTWWRKARTEHKPHGWRWADAGEESIHILSNKPGETPLSEHKDTPMVVEEDEPWDVKHNCVMPYPEDERLEE